jgi:ADP-ribosylglycohydrolase
MPYEGRPGFLTLDYYRPVPTALAPNDDLDLQLVWLQHVKECGLAVTSQVLGQAWLDHIDAHPDEYGVALWNLRRGLRPPQTGTHNNCFGDGMGAAIRSEIWATLFPGQPATAAWYAWQDAQVDHHGDGLYAELFLAALQSQLYASRDLRAAIACGLSFLPDACRLKHGLRGVIASHAEGLDYAAARDRVMATCGSANFTDCVMNLSFIMLGLLYGEGDFERSILAAVNCGQDTDCTGATVGATLGILLGAEAIPARWRRPIGDQLVVGDYIRDLPAPATVQELVNELLALRQRFAGQDVPVLPAPFVPPPVPAVADAHPWRLDGRPFTADGLWLRLSRQVPELSGRSAWLESDLVSPVARHVQLMVVSPGMFRCYVDGVHYGVWGAQTPIVPAFHRLVGGRVYNLYLRAGQRHHIRLEVLPTSPTPDVLVAVGDTQNRYLLDVTWHDPVPAATPQPAGVAG